MTNWALRRARFNHDRLKNEFMQSVLRAVRIFEGRVRDDCFIDTFFEELNYKWNTLLLEAKYLSLHAPRGVGVQSWFSEYPLCLLSRSDKVWMSEVLEREFWLIDRTVKKLSRLTQCLDATDHAVKVLTKTYTEFRRSPPKTSLLAINSLFDAAMHLYQCCYNMSDSISMLAADPPIAVLAFHEGRRANSSQP